MSDRPHLLGWEGVGPRLTGVLALAVIASVLAFGYLALHAFERAVQPELANRTRLVGSIVREAIQRPLERGVPFEALAGLDRYLSETIERFEEIQSISITSRSGRRLAMVERTAPPTLAQRASIEPALVRPAAPYSLPILSGNDLVGAIEVTVRPDFVQARMREVFLDVMVLGLVATLIALELAIGIALATVGKPLGRVLRLLGEQREGVFLHRIPPGGLGALGRTAVRLNDHAEDLATRLAVLTAKAREAVPAGLRGGISEGRPRRLRLSDASDIRPALFLLSVATEVTTSFLPIFAGAATRPNWLSAELAAAAPLLVYLVALAALMPFGGRLVERIGAQRLFVGSMAPIAVALAGMALAGSVVEITLWRGVIGFFYATATVACQEYALRAREGGSAARALGGYLAVVYAGVFCGSALGGVVADRFGYAAAFLTGAAIAAAAAALAVATMTGRAGMPGSSGAASSTGTARGGMNLRYLALLLGIALPMNAATAIFVWYLTPLMLAAEGIRTSDIARVVMLYYLAPVLFGSLVSRLAEPPSGPVALVLAGALGSGAALLSLSAWSGFWAVASVMAALGICHTLMRAPLYVIAVDIAARGGPDTGRLRLFERLGAIAGLAASTFLLRDAGAAASIQVLGVVVLSGAFLFAAAQALGLLRQDGRMQG